MRYANCGHLPGLLLRANGDLERLVATGTVLGLFKEWDCYIEERLLLPGDLLTLYTDGVTESLNAAGEEFGERRLIDALCQHTHLSPSALLREILNKLQEFNRSEQQDDITLIVGKC